MNTMLRLAHNTGPCITVEMYRTQKP